jgi:hypothetical protein
MTDIKQTKELVVWSCTLASALGTSLQDGRIGIGDLYNFMSVLSGSAAAFAGADLIPTELVDLDDAEKADLLVTVNKELRMPQENVETYVLAALQAASKLHDVYKILRDLKGVA